MKKNLKDYLITLTLILLCVWSAWNFMIRGGAFGAIEVPSDLAAGIHSELGGAASADLVLSSNERVQAKPVIIFVTSWCGMCRSLEKSLSTERIDFTVVDIEKNIHAAKYYQAIMGPKSGPVPVTLVGSRVFVGDQSKAIASASRAI